MNKKHWKDTIKLVEKNKGCGYFWNELLDDFSFRTIPRICTYPVEDNKITIINNKKYRWCNLHNFKYLCNKVACSYCEDGMICRKTEINNFENAYWCYRCQKGSIGNCIIDDFDDYMMMINYDLKGLLNQKLLKCIKKDIHPSLKVK